MKVEGNMIIFTNTFPEKILGKEKSNLNLSTIVTQDRMAINQL